MIRLHASLCPKLVKSLLSEVVVELAGVPVTRDHAVLQDAEGRILEGAMIKSGWCLIDANHRPTLEGGVLARQLLTVVVAQPLRRDGAVCKLIRESAVVAMAG